MVKIYIPLIAICIIITITCYYIYKHKTEKYVLMRNLGKTPIRILKYTGIVHKDDDDDDYTKHDYGKYKVRRNSSGQGR